MGHAGEQRKQSLRAPAQEPVALTMPIPGENLRISPYWPLAVQALLLCGYNEYMGLLSAKGSMVALGSQGPFFPGRDLGFSKYQVPLNRLNTHLYVVGRSGKGKSKFLEGFLWQLVHLGQGCGLIGPPTATWPTTYSSCSPSNPPARAGSPG
jgi:hypothetical protein